MKLLSLDQASRISGWSIFTDGKLTDYGKIDAEKAGASQSARLKYIRDKVKDLILNNNIDEVVFEDIQLQANRGNNVSTFKILAEVFGIISELCEELNIPQTTLLASVWKSKLGIKGKDRAEQKRNVQNWVQEKYNIKVIQDIADSVAIGSAYLNQQEKEKGFDWSD